MICSTNVKFDKIKIGPITSDNDVNNTGLGSFFTNYLPAFNAYPPAEDTSSGGDKVEEPSESEELSESNKQLLEREELDDGIPTLGSNTGPKPMPVPVPTAEPEKVRRSGRSNKGVPAVRLEQALIAMTLPSKIHHAFTTAISISETKTPNSYAKAMRSLQAAE